jgi:hypothetical protein
MLLRRLYLAASPGCWMGCLPTIEQALRGVKTRQGHAVGGRWSVKKRGGPRSSNGWHHQSGARARTSGQRCGGVPLLWALVRHGENQSLAAQGRNTSNCRNRRALSLADMARSHTSVLRGWGSPTECSTPTMPTPFGRRANQVDTSTLFSCRVI